MSFKKCPHTCRHASTKTESGILWSSGGTYATHVQSEKVHRHCTEGCPAYLNGAAPSPPITANDWEEYADATFERYWRNADAIQRIPIQYLSNANQRLHPQYESFAERMRRREESQRPPAPVQQEPPGRSPFS